MFRPSLSRTANEGIEGTERRILVHSSEKEKRDMGGKGYTP